METSNFMKRGKEAGITRYFVAVVLILAGMVLLFKNHLDPVWYQALISWPMLVIVMAVYLLIRRQLIAGIITGLVGLYYWLPLTGWTNYPQIEVLWPIALVGAGIALLFRPRRNRKKHFPDRINNTRTDYSADGFFRAHNTFGEVRQTVTDEIFRGGDIKNSFGSVVLDLRRCSLAEGETCIDVECSFGGIELYVPASWNIRVEIRPFMGGYEDSRLKGMVTDPSRVLVIRGNLSFSGLEIKG